MKFYPLLFEPISKQRIWGGTKLKDVLNKPFNGDLIGESWEISTVTNAVSVVVNGAFCGLNLNQLIAKYPQEILGKDCIENYGLNFPLLFKFLDAKEDLSIQVHPNDKLAQQRHNSFGKTEMWYVMQADPGARLVVGFKDKTNKDDYLFHLENKSLVTILNEVPVKKGDAFLLETGTVHAIGAGVLIAEIQQTSDVTYRLYDWDRVGTDGVKRDLHTDLAVDAINYEKTNIEVLYESSVNEKINLLQCAFFTTNILEVSGVYFWTKKTDMFTVFMCTAGSFVLKAPGFVSSFKCGDTVLIPAALLEFEIEGETSLLEITI